MRVRLYAVPAQATADSLRTLPHPGGDQGCKTTLMH